MPNNPLIVAAVQAICAGGSKAQTVDGGWTRDKTGAPVFEFWSGAGGRIMARVDAPAEEAWSDIESYSALTLDTAIALLASLASDSFRGHTAAPRREAVWLGPPAVINAKGYKRFGIERLEFAEAIEAELAKVKRLRFDIKNYPAFDPSARKWSDAGISRYDVALIELAPDAPASDPFNCRRGLPLRFGAWAEHWLNAGGAMWLSPLPAALLHFDHRENRGPDALAKKIGVLLTLNWGASRRNKQLIVSVRTLLRRIGQLQRPGATASVHSGRIADRVEEALMRLKEGDILPVSLRADANPMGRQQNLRWFDDWLDTQIVCERPTFMDPQDAKPGAALAS